MFMKNKLRVLFLCSIFFLSVTQVVSAENIDPNNVGNDYARLEVDSSSINFDCDNCTVTVSDSGITGLAWGETIGWISFNPDNGGVVNTNGTLSGMAWGEISGWINFAPDNGGVSINGDGYFSGTAWSENHGWIVFSCPGALSTCVQTSWTTGGSSSGGYIPDDTDEEDESSDNPTCDDPNALNFLANSTCVYGGDDGGEAPSDGGSGDDSGEVGGDTDEDINDDGLGGGENGGEDSTEDNGGGNGGDDILYDIENVSETRRSFSPESIPVAAFVLFALLFVLSQLMVTSLSQKLNSLLIAFGIRKREKPWGTVYDSVTKQPLDPAVVALTRLGGSEAQTAITDIDGRYGFLSSRGDYVMSANKTDYKFPSEKLFGKTEDLIYNNLYFGEEFHIENKDDVVNKDIPLDPVNFNWNEFEKKRTGVMKFHSTLYLWYIKIARIMFWVGFAFSLYVVALYPIPFNIVIVVLYGISLLAQITGFGGRTYGIVRDAQGYPLSFAKITVFSSELQREVKKTIIGATGHYFILIPKGDYFFTVEKRVSEHEYIKVYQSNSKSYHRGFINKKITISS